MSSTTEAIMLKETNFVFKALQVMCWIIFIGLSIEAGGLLVNFIFSLYNPEMVSRLYNKLDLSEVYGRSRAAFFSLYSFILAIAILKAHLFYVVIWLLSKLDLSKPFNEFVSRQVVRISYFTFSIGLLSYIGRQTAKSLGHKGYVVDGLDAFWADSQAFILMAAVIYVIATIIKKGVNLQTESELTV